VAKTKTTPEAGTQSAELTAQIHKALKRLRKVAPDLACSPSHAETMRRTTKRMERWADRLHRGTARRRLAAEAEKMRRRATSLTGSEKKARTLRALTADIELAVRRLHKTS